MRKNIMRFLTTNNQQPTTCRKAFTLIELLVVSTIIVLLATVVVVNLEKARVKSRDVQRKADLSKIAAALDLYKVDNKSYLDKGTAFIDFTNANLTELNSNYLAVFPVDPIDDTTYKYQYKGTLSEFKIRAKSETIIATDCDAAGVADNAKYKAGDFYDSATGSCTYFQVSSSSTALAW